MGAAAGRALRHLQRPQVARADHAARPRLHPRQRRALTRVKRPHLLRSARNVGGAVCEINLFFTEIDGDDNTRIIIPNGKLWGEIVRVPKRNDTTWIELRFQRPANDDIGAAIARLGELIQRDKRVLGSSTSASRASATAITRWPSISGCPGAT
ncbi:MAG: mechanosensitive ion channel [Rhodospirillales bacterium]|nr:mechanosensitive ion channel [Rhodospirillales bacterium]